MFGPVNIIRENSGLVNTTCLVLDYKCKLWSPGWKPVCVGAVIFDVEYKGMSEMNAIKISNCRNYTGTCKEIYESLNNTLPIGLSLECYYSSYSKLSPQEIYLSVPDRSENKRKLFIAGIILIGLGTIPIGIYITLNCIDY